MTKSNDSLKQFVELRAALEREHAALRQRLQQVEAALSGAAAAAPKAVAAPAAARKPAAGRKAAPQKPSAAKPAAAAKPGRVSPGMRETIAKLVAKSPLRIGDIVAGMKRSGYVFKSSNPTNSVGAYLYGAEGKKHFVRTDGKFSLKPGAKL